MVCCLSGWQLSRESQELGDGIFQMWVKIHLKSTLFTHSLVLSGVITFPGFFLSLAIVFLTSACLSCTISLSFKDALFWLFTKTFLPFVLLSFKLCLL